MKTNEEWAKLYISEVGSKYSKNIKFRPKSESKLLKIVSPLATVFNKNFTNGYITTIGDTIWYPDGWLERIDVKNLLQVIAHECIHIKQKSEQTQLVHNFLYLFPQSVAIFSLLSLLAIPFGSAWLWCLLFLLCLAPLPAPFRYMKELEAYRVKFLFIKHVHNNEQFLLEFAKEVIIENMSKSNYYFTWPFTKCIIKDLNDETKLNKEQYKEIVKFLERYNLLYINS